MSTVTKFARRSMICQKCDQKMKDGTTCTSILEQIEEGWERKDLCEECTSEEIEDNAIAAWKTEIVAKKNKAVVLSEDAIWQVLKKAVEDEELRSQALTFILCLMMARKRKLRNTKNWKKNGHEYQTFSNLSRKVVLDVQVPMLGPAAFSKLQKDIGEFFKESD